MVPDRARSFPRRPRPVTNVTPAQVLALAEVLTILYVSALWIMVDYALERMLEVSFHGSASRSCALVSEHPWDTLGGPEGEHVNIYIVKL